MGPSRSLVYSIHPARSRAYSSSEGVSCISISSLATLSVINSTELCTELPSSSSRLVRASSTSSEPAPASQGFVASAVSSGIAGTAAIRGGPGLRRTRLIDRGSFLMAT